VTFEPKKKKTLNQTVSFLSGCSYPFL
jgi:hypothetical protein